MSSGKFWYDVSFSALKSLLYCSNPSPIPVASSVLMLAPLVRGCTKTPCSPPTCRRERRRRHVGGEQGVFVQPLTKGASMSTEEATGIGEGFEQYKSDFSAEKLTSYQNLPELISMFTYYADLWNKYGDPFYS